MGDMKSMRGPLSAALIGMSLFASGCASIVHSGNRTITINSEPPGATASVRTEEGEIVHAQKTPCTVSLEPKRGYFKGQSYVLRLEMPGYESTEVPLKATLSGWYFGNLIFGGLIGMLAVDPNTGAMWNIEPSKVERKLNSSQAEVIKNKTGFVVVLASELTEKEKAGMTRLN
jgi:hypothetical protein